MQDVIRMTNVVALCHPDEITKIWSLSHPSDIAIPNISSGWLIVDAICHPDDILFHSMSSGWLNWGWFLIRMSYGNVIMSSGWDTLPFLSHPDEIANFDFPQHAVALQRFRRNLCACFCFYRRNCLWLCLLLSTHLQPNAFGNHSPCTRCRLLHIALFYDNIHGGK